MVRDKTRKIACLAKILREMTNSVSHFHDTEGRPSTATKKTHQGGEGFISTFVSSQHSTALVCQRPNMIEIEAKMSWMCRFFNCFPVFSKVIIMMVCGGVAGNADIILIMIPLPVLLLLLLLEQVRSILPLLNFKDKDHPLPLPGHPNKKVPIYTNVPELWKE